MNDDLLFADGDEAVAAPAARDALSPDPWLVLVVDDDRGIHAMTRLVLRDLEYQGRRVEILSAHSGIEARAILAARTDIALALVDVVMETDDSGLRLVRHIREELGNARIRIVLRTGQPGHAPEWEVIVGHDINDYKAKTELTAVKLRIATITALRAYHDITALEASRQGLEKILNAQSSLLRERTLDGFAANVLAELGSLTGAGADALLCARAGDGFAALDPALPIGEIVIAGSGRYQDCAGQKLASAVAEPAAALIAQTLRERRHCWNENHAALFIGGRGDREAVVYLGLERPLGPFERQLAEVLCGKVALGLDNIHLYDQIQTAHKAAVVALAALAEYRDTDTGDHVVRVARMTEEIARVLLEAGHFVALIDSVFLEQIGTASILHDVGKVSIPDSILLKPGALTPEERAAMECHAANGGAILRKAADLLDGGSYLALGAEIAACHHERFDGTGYPHRLRGQDIPLSARIVAAADAFDALTSKRPYKEPWPRDRAAAFIRDSAGSHFDPLVVEAFGIVLARRDAPAVP